MSDSDDNADGQIENGHLPSDDNTASGPNTNNSFDLDLPASHRYLGKLDNVHGYAFYEDGEIVTLAAIQTNTLVFPGFILPLVLNNDLEINMIQRHTMGKNSFVLLSPSKNFQGVYPYGVIMEIFETHLQRDVLYLKARSRQRCKLVPRKPIRTLIGELYEVTIQAMLEPCVSSPIANTQLRSLHIARPHTCDDFTQFQAIQKYRRYHLSQYPYAAFIYNMYEVCFLTKKLTEGLSKYYFVEFIPKDPVQLSYWFVQNYQLRHEERLKIMTLGTTVERLRQELSYMTLKRLICCASCEIEIARQSDIFPMSKDGVQSNYCNPGGHVYETLTVTQAKNFSLIGPSSPEFSWFPGYAWTIMQCAECWCYLGWKFTSGSLNPLFFYGLAKSGFDIKILSEEV